MKKGQDKPFKSMNGKVFTANRDQLKAEVQKEINARRVSIDRSEFQKDEMDKFRLKEKRKEWNRSKTRDKGVIDAIIEAVKAVKRPRANISVTIDQTLAV